MIRAAVIGLGRAGSGDRGNPSRSHVGAILAVDGLVLAAAVDPSPRAREAARENWDLPASVALLARTEDLAEGSCDVIAVAAPTELRRQTVSVALAKKPKVLIVEKPLARTPAEAEELIAAARKKSVALRVNFHRRLDPDHAAFRAALPADPLHVIVHYGKGLFNYASHMVDLLVAWFGPVEMVESLSMSGDAPDPNVTFRLRMARGFDALFVGLDGLSYDQFEAEFYLPGGKFELVSGGVEKRRARTVPDRFYKGYMQLDDAEEMFPPKPVGGFRELYKSVRDHLVNGTPLAGCGPDDALHVMAVLAAALDSARSGGRLISVPAMAGGTAAE